MLLSGRRPNFEAPQPPISLYKGDGFPYCSDPNCAYCADLKTVLNRCGEGPPETSVKTTGWFGMASRRPVKVLVKGKESVGEYEIQGALLRVFFAGKNKAAHIRGSDPELFARLLLIELLNRV